MCAREGNRALASVLEDPAGDGPRHRAGVVSTFFAAAYVGLGLTAVLTGLISLRVTTGPCAD